jgi:hypothetical protein
MRADRVRVFLLWSSFGALGGDVATTAAGQLRGHGEGSAWLAWLFRGQPLFVGLAALVVYRLVLLYVAWGALTEPRSGYDRWLGWTFLGVFGVGAWLVVFSNVLVLGRGVIA